MRTTGRPTWLDYLDTMHGKSCGSDQLYLTDFNNFINANSFAHSFFQHSIPFIYLLNYRTGLYINMSENFAGYESGCFLNEGINHTIQIQQRDHLKLFNQQIFPDRLEFLRSIPAATHKDYVFSYNTTVKNRKGEEEHYLQRNSFLSDEMGNPIFSMGILINVTHYNNQNTVFQTIDKIDTSGLSSCETIYKKIYYLNEEDKLFSKREKEVLLWMADGLSSKMIADKLFVSEYTIVNHRRHMQDKAHVPNAIALVGFAIKSGII